MESGTRVGRDYAGRAIANAEAEARLAESRSLFRSLPDTPREKRGRARDIVKLEPEQQELEVARINREKPDGVGAEEGFQRLSSEVKQRLSDELRTIEQELATNRISFTNGVSTGGAGEAEARNEELLAKRDTASDLALLNPEEMAREVTRRNRARRGAILAGQRQRRRAADDLKANENKAKRAGEIYWEGVAPRPSGGLDSAGAGQEEAFRVRQADVRALAGWESRRMAREVARTSRARRFAILLGLRNRSLKRAAAEASAAASERKKLRVDREAVTDGMDSSDDSAEARQEVAIEGIGTAGDLGSAEARQDELPATRVAHTRAMAETDHPLEVKVEIPWKYEEVRAGEALMDGVGTGALGSAEATQKELPATREHAHARALAETDHGRESEGGGALRNGEVGAEKALVDGVGTGDLGSAEARQEKFPATREHAHARAMAETDHGRESEGGGALRNGEIESEKALVDGVGTGDLDSAEARQEELPATREHAHARALAETDHGRESEGGGALRNGEVGSEKTLVDGVGNGEVGRNSAIMDSAGAGGFAFAEARLEELRARAVAEVARRVAGNAKVHPDGRVLVDGIWTGEMGRNSALDGEGAGSFAFTEARLEELRANAAAEVAERVVRDAELKVRGRALVNGAGSGNVNRNEAVVEGIGVGRFAFMEARLEKLRARAVAEMTGRVTGNDEVQPDLRTLVDGVGTGEVDRNAAVVSGAGARGFPIAATKIAEVPTQAVAEVAGRVTRDAGEVKRNADLARDGNAEEPQTGGTALMDGVGTGGLDRNEAAVDGAGAGGFPFLDPKQEELGTEAVAEVAGRVVREAAEVQRKTDVARACRAENLQTDGQARTDGIGTGGVGRKAAVVDGAGAGGFPFLEATLEMLRTEAVEVVERSGQSERHAGTEDGGGMSAKDDVQEEVHAEVPPLANFGIRYAASCAAVVPPPGLGSFVPAGFSGASLSAQHPAQGLQDLALCHPGATGEGMSAEGTPQGRLADVGDQSAAACPAVTLPPGPESFVLAGCSGAGVNTQQTAQGLQPSAYPLYWAARGGVSADNASDTDDRRRAIEQRLEARTARRRERERLRSAARREAFRPTLTYTGFTDTHGLADEQWNSARAAWDARREKERLRGAARRKAARQKAGEEGLEKERLRSMARREAARQRRDDKETELRHKAVRETRRLQQRARRQRQREVVAAEAAELAAKLSPDHPVNRAMRKKRRVQQRARRQKQREELAAEAVELGPDHPSANPEEAITEGGSKDLAMVDGNGGGGGSGGGGREGRAAAGLDNVSAYDFAERATRFESSFAEADAAAAKNAVPITVMGDTESFDRWLESQTPQSKYLIKSFGHDSYKAGQVVMVLSASTEGKEGGSLAEVAFCRGEGEDSLGSPFSLCSLPKKLPVGTYALRGANGDLSWPDAAALSWALGSYSFGRYKSKSGSEAGTEESKAEGGGSNEAGVAGVEGKVLAWPGGADKRRVSATAASAFLVRDLLTTRCEDMGPQHLEDVFASMGKEFNGYVRVVKGDDLLKEGDSYPMIHAAGRAAGAGREPRLLDLTWTPPNSEGNPNLKKVTLVGNGVCFGTGGLEIKPSADVLSVEKNMGGGAQVLGLARMIMAQELPVRLRVLLPAVEKTISGDGTFGLGDGIETRSENAEGRLVLADALLEASSESPDLIIDCATLTGAAREALGTKIPVMFCNDEEVAAKLHSFSRGVFDQVSRQPLWEDYRKELSLKIADLRNIGGGGHGDTNTAAPYLDEFVGKNASAEPQQGVSNKGGGGGQKLLPCIHMDFMGFNPASRLEGGEAQGMRAFCALIEDMFGA